MFLHSWIFFLVPAKDQCIIFPYCRTTSTFAVWRVAIIFLRNWVHFAFIRNLPPFHYVKMLCLFQKFYYNLLFCLQIICKSSGIINVPCTQWSCSYLGMWAALEDLRLSIIWCNGYPFNKFRLAQSPNYSKISSSISTETRFMYKISTKISLLFTISALWSCFFHSHGCTQVKPTKATLLGQIIIHDLIQMLYLCLVIAVYSKQIKNVRSMGGKYLLISTNSPASNLYSWMTQCHSFIQILWSVLNLLSASLKSTMPVLRPLQ